MSRRADLKPTYTEISVTRHEPRWSTAPNGSSSGLDYCTTVILRQDYPTHPDLGCYSGRSYRITQSYISTTPDHRGQYTGSSSTPWTD